MKMNRNSNFELLRIIAILMIILSHFCVHGVGYLNTDFSINGLISSVFTLGNLGVVIFVMISGFFLVYSDKTKWIKVIKIVCIYCFYTLLFYFLSIGFKINEFVWEGFIKTVFGLFYERSWFVPIYILIYIFHPYINLLFKHLDDKKIIIFLILITVCWSVIPTFTGGNFALNNLVSVFCCYCYGASLRYFQDKKVKWYSKKIGLYVFLIPFALMVLSAVTIYLIGIKWTAFLAYSNWFYGKTSILVILASGGLIMFTSQSKPFYFKPINFIAGFSLGIYLIHDNDSIRDWLWHDLLKVQELYTNNLMILYMFGICIAIFAVCLCIDIIRHFVLEKPFFLLIDCICKKKRETQAKA